MGNANVREEGSSSVKSNNVESDYITVHNPNHHQHRSPSSDLMENTPPVSPPRSRSPSIFAPQVPVAPLERKDGPSPFNQNESYTTDDLSPENGIPTLITWNYGGTIVAVEGSWDNWRTRKMLQRSGKDHTILLVLASGIYHYKFIVDGELRYSPDLPSIADEMGHVCNLLDVHVTFEFERRLEEVDFYVMLVASIHGYHYHPPDRLKDYVPETLDSVAEFEAPASPDSGYSQDFPREEDFAKDPVMVPSQLHLSVLGTEDSDDSLRPQHVVLNHLFIEKGWASQSVVALGLTHRFQSKYVTVVLYKPLQR